MMNSIMEWELQYKASIIFKIRICFFILYKLKLKKNKFEYFNMILIKDISFNFFYVFLSDEKLWTYNWRMVFLLIWFN